MEQPEQHPINDSSFVQQVQRLHRLTVYGRWAFVTFLWITLLPLCLWNLRTEISILQQYFTWVSLQYGLIFHPLSALGLVFCISTTIAVLVWQGRNMISGLPQNEKERLEKQVCRIRQQGKSHPLWKWVCRE
jgi:hypothetical protein